MSGASLDECFFRHAYGNLVATLSRRFGTRYIEDVEDAVQSALLTAVETWARTSVPDNPQAWLFRVALNNLLGELRRRNGQRRILEQTAEGNEAPDGAPELSFDGELRDDLLRMLFVCCDESIAPESQLVLALKTVCGFSVREISFRLFASEANVYKRFSRARNRLKAVRFRTDEVEGRVQGSRLPAVQNVLYIMFTEGYLSSSAETALRRELCDEATRLAMLLAEHPVGQTPETYALLAVMYLHEARMTARQDETGNLLLLEEQSRALWDEQKIQLGMEWLAKSASGDRFSRYHAEAAIAAEHCLAASFAETRWDKIVEYYLLLEQVAPSALHTLNRAVAVAEWRTPADGLAILEGFNPPHWLAASYMWAAVLADLHGRNGQSETAAAYVSRAIELAPTPAVISLLQRRFSSLAHSRRVL